LRNPASNRFGRLRIGVVTLSVIAILAFAGSSAYDVWRAYENSLFATQRELGALANALAEQTALAWNGVDLLLRDIVTWYQSDGHKLAPERLDEYLTEIRATCP
jgi:hypothetical protein